MIQHFLYMKNWKYYPMLQNMMSPVLPVVLPAVERKECSGNTEAAGICHSFFFGWGAVCLCLKSYLAMNVFMIVSIV